MTWWYAVVEGRHELQNPTSPEKIQRLGETLALGPGSRVLDVASGRGGPALLLAGASGCRITCVERAPEFVAAARERVGTAGLQDLIEVVEADASAVDYERSAYDAALCLGATFVFGGLTETVAALRPAVRPRGFVAVGEPYLRSEAPFEEFLPLAETVERFAAAGVEPVRLIASSEDDWDRYETLHWLALDEWLVANPAHPQAEEFREEGRRRRDEYLRRQRRLLGWAIFVGRLP
ncbi:MAG TPA: class I SAM-dependent methyltransferase [Gaiellaceae bacterium]